MRAGRTLLSVVTAVFLAGCIHQEVEVSDLDMATSTQPIAQDESVKPELVIEDVTNGGGAEVKQDDRVVVHYTGTFPDGKVFDSSRERKIPFTFTVGAGEVIQGWDVGILGARVGGKRRLTIPPQFAYGSRGSGTVIPPNATLIFDIEVLDVNPEITQ